MATKQGEKTTPPVRRVATRRPVEKVTQPADCGLVLFNKHQGLPPGLGGDASQRGHLVGGTVTFRPWDKGQPGEPIEVDLDDIHFTQFCHLLHESSSQFRGLLAVKTMVDALLDSDEIGDDYSTFDGLVGISYVVNTLLEAE